jgi:hypothetical protein
MKYTFKTLGYCFALSLCSWATYAQNEEDLANFLKAGAEDASQLVQEYVKPVVTGVSYGMTGGWYHTAKPHKPFGIDLGVSVNLAFIPTSDNYFDPNKFLSSSTTFSNLSNPGSGAPTIFGPKDDTQYTATYDPDGNGPLDSQNITFNGPEGLNMKEEIGFAAVPVPMAQIGIGLIKGTDLKVRLVPKQEFGGSEVQMFGVGIMHDIKQYIPGIKSLPFDLSALVAYNSVKGETNLVNTNSNDSRPDSQDGKFDYTFNSWVIQGIISKKISVVTAYAGIGYNLVNTNADIRGTYTIEGSSASFNVTDPVSIAFKNNSPRFTAGVRLKFGPLYLNTDYTIQKFSMWSAGLGFSVR